MSATTVQPAWSMVPDEKWDHKFFLLFISVVLALLVFLAVVVGIFFPMIKAPVVDVFSFDERFSLDVPVSGPAKFGSCAKLDIINSSGVTIAVAKQMPTQEIPVTVKCKEYFSLDAVFEAGQYTFYSPLKADFLSFHPESLIKGKWLGHKEFSPALQLRPDRVPFMWFQLAMYTLMLWIGACVVIFVVSLS